MNRKEDIVGRERCIDFEFSSCKNGEYGNLIHMG